MRTPKISACGFLTVLLDLFCAVAPRLWAQERHGFRPLFNGKDLSGWVVMPRPRECLERGRRRAELRCAAEVLAADRR
jgi:hypothetical protein